MKWKGRTAAFMLVIFTASLLGSLVFSLWMVLFDVYNMQAYGVQPYTIQPYAELLYIIISLFVVTVAMLFMIRRNMSRTIMALFAIVSFFVLVEFFSVLFFAIGGSYLAPTSGFLGLVAAAFGVFYYFKYAGQMARNVMNMLIFLTIAAVIAVALGPVPSLILIGVIAIYDYISVFVTKHMITLAKGLKDKGFLAGITFAAKRTKSVGVMLGGGDIVFPGILIDAMFLWYSFAAGLFVLAAAVIGLALIIFFGKKGRAYPAMAVIGPMQILFFGTYLLATMV